MKYVEALTNKTPKEISRFYISCLDPNIFDMSTVTEEMIKDHENELAKQIELYVIEKCKETARNVRHKASDIVNEHLNRIEVPIQINIDIDRDLMNIRFDDVSPCI